MLLNTETQHSLQQGTAEQVGTSKSLGTEENGEALNTWLNLATISPCSSKSWESSCLNLLTATMADLRRLKTKDDRLEKKTNSQVYKTRVSAQQTSVSCVQLT